MSWIDWLIIALSIVALRLISLSCRRHMRSVADFLSANRSAGRYLLTVAGTMGSVGVISYVGGWQATYQVGVAPGWWAYMSSMVGVIILFTGWVYYRFRETRALTMAQFLEMRYSRRLRIFAGTLCWMSGILNFGLFPAVAARFFVYFCGLPEHIPGLPVDIPTFAVIMAAELVLTLMFVNMGGQVSVMVTECAQGIFSALVYVLVTLVILHQVQYSQIMHAFSLAPENQSMINPFKTSQVKDFNFWFYFIGIVGAFYGYMSWQGTQGFYSAARSPHEQKMGGMIAVWRNIPMYMMMGMIPAACYAIMHLPQFTAQAESAKAVLAGISSGPIRDEMTVPIVLTTILPIGVKGLFATIMLFATFTCHDTYLHSWGSIFIQDVYLPLKRKVLTPEQHIKFLRWSIIGVALFAYVFSLLYVPNQKILMFFAATSTIWLGGSGACIVGGLYWRKGTTAGAYTALIVGAVTGIGALVVPQVWPKFPINSQWLSFLAIISACLFYVVVSLSTRRKDFNIEKMLHRGIYRDEEKAAQEAQPMPSKWRMILGITEEFSFGDRILAVAQCVWTYGWFIVFVIGTAINLMMNVPDSAWIRFWTTQLYIMVAISIPSVIWFTIGGIIDIKGLFAHLATAERDHSDDGTVRHEEELSSAVAEEVPLEPVQEMASAEKGEHRP